LFFRRKVYKCKKCGTVIGVKFSKDHNGLCIYCYHSQVSTNREPKKREEEIIIHDEFITNPIFISVPHDNQENTLKGGDGEFSGAGATGDWDSNSESNNESQDSGSSDCESSYSD